jgi:hypothetical protein
MTLLMGNARKSEGKSISLQLFAGWVDLGISTKVLRHS